MKNMDVGELRPRQVIDEEDDQVQVLSNSNVQASSSDSHDNVQDQVASTSSQPNDQGSASNVPILQSTNIARDHSLNTIIRDILEVYKQDHDRLHFVSISHLCHLLNQRR